MVQMNLTTRNAAIFMVVLFSLLFFGCAIGSSYSTRLHEQQPRFWELFGGSFSSLMLIMKVDGVKQETPAQLDLKVQ